MSLANTKWNLNDGSGTTSTVSFGPNQAPAGQNAGGNGLKTTHYSPPTGDLSVEILWIEDGKGNYMYQTKGPTDPGNKELPTSTGSYHNNSAIGWGSNFDAAWGTWGESMIKQP